MKLIKKQMLIRKAPATVLIQTSTTDEGNRISKRSDADRMIAASRCAIRRVMRISILADRRDCQRSEKLVVSRLYMTVMWRPDGLHRRACAASMQRPSAQHAAQWLAKG